MSLTIYIDFDGVLHDPGNVHKGYKMGVPILGAREAMMAWHEAGHDLVVFTVRATSDKAIKAVADWLDYFEIPYGRITNVKGPAHVYVDNLGYRFDTFPALNRYIATLVPSELRQPKATAESPVKPVELPAAVDW